MKHESERAGRTAVVMDPHPLCHSAISGLLARFDIEVVGATTSPDAAVALLQEHKPDILMAELDMPEGRHEGLRVLSAGRAADARLTVIVLSATDDAGLIDAAFAQGASAYVLKTSEPDVVATAVRQAFEPSLYFARPEPAPAPVAAVAPPKLTRREREILALVSEGRSNRQVAELLWVTDQTVKFHLANVYRKLGVRSRFDAARWAFEHGILEPATADELLAPPAPVHTNGNGNGNGNGSGNGKGASTLVRVAPGSRAAARGRFEGTSR